MRALSQYLHPGDPQTPADLVQNVQQGTPVHTALYFVVMLILLCLPMLDLVHSIIMFGAMPTLVAESPEHAMTVLTAALETAPWATLEMLALLFICAWDSVLQHYDDSSTCSAQLAGMAHVGSAACKDNLYNHPIFATDWQERRRHFVLSGIYRVRVHTLLMDQRTASQTATAAASS
jgi:hypothetical protein